MNTFEREAPELDVEIGGRALRLRYSVNSLCEIEDRAGMPIDRLLVRQYSATRLLLWAGLRACQPEVTVWEVGELITEALRRGDSLERIIDLCAEGLWRAGIVQGEPMGSLDP